MDNHDKINYIEFPARNIEATKAFFSKAFAWSFQDYGPEYTSFSDAGGNILKEIFSFPGGRRFHFTEPSGNEFAVWSE